MLQKRHGVAVFRIGIDRLTSSPPTAFATDCSSRFAHPLFLQIDELERDAALFKSSAGPSSCRSFSSYRKSGCSCKRSFRLPLLRAFMIRLHNSCADGRRHPPHQNDTTPSAAGSRCPPARLLDAHEHALHLGIPLLQHRKRIARCLQQMLVCSASADSPPSRRGLVVHHQGHTVGAVGTPGATTQASKGRFRPQGMPGPRRFPPAEERHFCARVFARCNACSHIAGEPPLKRRIKRARCAAVRPHERSNAC